MTRDQKHKKIQITLFDFKSMNIGTFSIKMDICVSLSYAKIYIGPKKYDGDIMLPNAANVIKSY